MYNHTFKKKYKYTFNFNKHYIYHIYDTQTVSHFTCETTESHASQPAPGIYP